MHNKFRSRKAFLTQFPHFPTPRSAAYGRAKENVNEAVVLPSFQVMSSVADKGIKFRRNNSPAHSIISKSLSTDVHASGLSRDQPRRLPPILPPLQLPDRGIDINKNQPRRIPLPLPSLSISGPRARGRCNRASTVFIAPFASSSTTCVRGSIAAGIIVLISTICAAVSSSFCTTAQGHNTIQFSPIP
ncbi:hypothetical protein F5887DRAFT_1011180 [Amanita rubescens]|nr:hypothetical protein F5887DRAFT_1011180 [Amanita rubescens]